MSTNGSMGDNGIEVIPEDPGERERLETVLHRFGEQAAASSNGAGESDEQQDAVAASA